MFRIKAPVDILRTNTPKTVVMRRLPVVIKPDMHRVKIQSYTYTPFSTQPNLRLIPLQKIVNHSLKTDLSAFSTGPITTTTYINTNKEITGDK